ncbi:interferon-induced protein with tetratricopeptide repeats 5-like [Rhineura floridana]|uniref:interferon-induced protein with tetratricopeptide repeats 5-like n=1 Tax=Rhineura floridana TaxID=261503 RepID=UPI002AC86E1C|nr:interferon-induced protein with tetratricopeptide repeats 5-like [Rhineura floridana]
MQVTHILKTLALQAEHTPHRNHATFIAMKAYLQHLQGDYREALGSLREAEEVLKRDHLANFSRQALVTYGNYAWVYYHLANFDMVELYLGRIRETCRSLASSETYSVLTPEIHAQKGWSLLAVGFRNREEAQECFRMALQGDESNEEFNAGLATSVYACYCHTWAPDHLEEAQRLLEEVVDHQPQNYEAKVYLAKLLQTVDMERSSCLAEDAVQNSFNPEVLRKASKVYVPQRLPRAISILNQAIVLDCGYHLLHNDLGLSYMKLLERASQDDRENIVAAAIESFKRSLEIDSSSIFSRLKLAKLYGEKAPAYEEEMYLTLMEGLPGASKRCQQAIYLHWGDFLLHKKGLKHQALEMYQASFRIPGGHALERKDGVERLEHLARMFLQDSEMDQVHSIYSFLEEMGIQDPRRRRGRGAWHESGRAQR